mmetsp:Transcript_24441/g.92301  ORF Transcript_24441/g.92301 Transcript_24441/m.92301 type:complete len:298 (+) Transcript_24441:1641-2534(+)
MLCRRRPLDPRPAAPCGKRTAPCTTAGRPSCSGAWSPRRASCGTAFACGCACTGATRRPATTRQAPRARPAQRTGTGFPSSRWAAARRTLGPSLRQPSLTSQQALPQPWACLLGTLPRKRSRAVAAAWPMSRAAPCCSSMRPAPISRRLRAKPTRWGPTALALAAQLSRWTTPGLASGLRRQVARAQAVAARGRRSACSTPRRLAPALVRTNAHSRLSPEWCTQTLAAHRSARATRVTGLRQPWQRSECFAAGTECCAPGRIASPEPESSLRRVRALAYLCCFFLVAIAMPCCLCAR